VQRRKAVGASVGDSDKVLIEAAKLAASESQALPSSRFWPLFALVACTILLLAVSAPLTAYSIFYKPDPAAQARSVQAEADRDRKVQELTSVLGRMTLALAGEKSERQKDNEAYQAQSKEDRQRIAKLEAQTQKIAALEGKVASLEKDTKRLIADFVKSLLASGATPSTSTYVPVPNRPKLPPELEKFSPDLAEEARKPRCLLTLKGYGLLCETISPVSHE
jgi:hypothetical protein